jgi:DNA-binding beta-propeller fold protein YncE
MTRARLALALLIPALTATLAPTHLLAQSAPYKILKTDKLGGEGGWDYLAAASAARRLYLARSGPNGNLHVYNLDTLAPIGEVPTGPAHGAAIDDATHHGFATSTPVTMFDTQTLKVIKTLPTQGRPDGYLDDPVTHHVYILSHVSPNITVLDAATGDILKAFDVGGEPEQSVLDNQGHLFVDLEDKDAIAVVDTKTFAVTAKYDISSKGGGCAGLAIDAAHGVLFAACRDKNNMIILSTADGKIITTLPIGVGCDGAEYNPDTQEVFSTQGDGTLTVIKDLVTLRSEPTATDFVVEQTVPTQKGARTITLDKKTGHLLTATAEFGPPPPPQPGQRYSRAPMIPGTFTLFVIGK